MIADLLIALPWLMPAVLFVILLAGPPLGAWLADRPKAAVALTVLSLVPIAALTMVPIQRELYGVCAFDLTLPTLGRVELFANLVLFVPLALLLGVATKRLVITFIAASGLSVIIEALQAALPVIGRSCDTSDWLANSIGAAIGVVLAGLALWIRKRRDRLRVNEEASYRDK